MVGILHTMHTINIPTWTRRESSTIPMGLRHCGPCCDHAHIKQSTFNEDFALYKPEGVQRKGCSGYQGCVERKEQVWEGAETVRAWPAKEGQGM